MSRMVFAVFCILCMPKAHAQELPTAADYLLTQESRNDFVKSVENSVVQVFATSSVQAPVPTTAIRSDGAALVVQNDDSTHSYYISTADWLQNATKIQIAAQNNTLMSAEIVQSDLANNIVLLRSERQNDLHAAKIAEAESGVAYALLKLPLQQHDVVQASFIIGDLRMYAKSSIRANRGYPIFNAKGHCLGLVVRLKPEQNLSDVVHYHLLNAFLKPKPAQEAPERLEFKNYSLPKL